jgi:predicted transcriptional regulator
LISFACWSEQVARGCLPAASATALKLAPNTLTFHLDRLRNANLVTVKREGRSMIYAARYETMNGLLEFLTENCCQGNSGLPTQGVKPRRGSARSKKEVS